MKLNVKPSRKGFTLVELLVVMAIIAVLASIATPLVLNKRKDADRTKAVGHATQVRLAIVEFENDYNTRPGEDVVDDDLFDGAAAGSANDVFRQLLQGLPSVRSEAIFFAPSLISTQPDNDIGDNANDFAEACEDGEVGFLYVDAPDARSGAPLIGAPLFDDQSESFDFDAYNGKAVFLKSDGSVDVLKIDEETEEVTIRSSGSDVNILSSENRVFREDPTIIFPIGK